MDAMEFSRLRYGMFVHFGLFSMLGRGEWVMNRERIAPEQMEALARQFAPERFDAEAVCDLAVEGGMKYLVFTTMHHEGFRMYDTALTGFNAPAVCGRDLVAEIVAAARRRNLKTGLYHSLNNWHDQPDAVAALESKEAYETFIGNTFARLTELVRRFPGIDIVWYDGWWPFDQFGWQAEKMNRCLREIQPQLLFNGRNCLPGDFGTPEQHLTAPVPWRPWEACMTLNDHWGFHAHDQNWKRPAEVVKMLLTCGAERGNLLLNIGPAGDGSIPAESLRIIREVGAWLRAGGDEAIADCVKMPFDSLRQAPGPYCGDWDNQGIFTASGNNLFFTMLYCPGAEWTCTGVLTPVRRVSVRGIGDLEFRQELDKLTIRLPEAVQTAFAPVLKLECDAAPGIYRTGGLRVPACDHTRYDPVMPDIQY